MDSVVGRARSCAILGVATGFLLGCAGETQAPASSGSSVAARLGGLDQPVRLVGMRAEAVDALLGPPELARSERRAQYRRYDVGGCAVDLYLYDAPSNGSPKVAWFEVRPADPLVALDSRACSWLEERLGAPGAPERRAAGAPS